MGSMNPALVLLGGTVQCFNKSCGVRDQFPDFSGYFPLRCAGELLVDLLPVKGTGWAVVLKSQCGYS